MAACLHWCRLFLVVIGLWIFATSPLDALSCKVVVYNLNNYFLKAQGDTFPKSPNSLSAVDAILTKLEPDVLVVSEMGSRTDLACLQSRLKKAGHNLPYAVWLNAPDAFRHVALLSRFPIERNNSRPLVPTRLPGHFIKRGILDVTLRLKEDYTLRLVSTHLKSQKLSTGNSSSHQIRLAEAQALASHIQKILLLSSRTSLLVCGDFNDHPSSLSLKTISTALLQDLAPADTRGESWTHYFARKKTYSRYDYLLASPALIPQITHTGIADSPKWRLASDHRPLYVSISL